MLRSCKSTSTKILTFNLIMVYDNFRTKSSSIILPHDRHHPKSARLNLNEKQKIMHWKSNKLVCCATKFIFTSPNDLFLSECIHFCFVHLRLSLKMLLTQSSVATLPYRIFRRTHKKASNRNLELTKKKEIARGKLIQEKNMQQQYSKWKRRQTTQMSENKKNIAKHPPPSHSKNAYAKLRAVCKSGEHLRLRLHRHGGC